VSLNSLETSVVKSRPSVPHGANFSKYMIVQTHRQTNRHADCNTSHSYGYKWRSANVNTCINK